MVGMVLGFFSELLCPPLEARGEASSYYKIVIYGWIKERVIGFFRF